ncbi:MAG: hypothetical protein IJP44_03880 [Bacteroidales bacterium]|nr:hypothetical protein [Bacteroidales bacterium]
MRKHLITLLILTLSAIGSSAQTDLHSHVVTEGYLEFDTLSIHVAIERQLETYPKSTLQDVYKSFYQEHFGPEHMISDTASVRQYLDYELAQMTEKASVYFEPTGSEGAYVRVSLSAVADSLITAEQLLDAFIRSANARPKPSTDWATKWETIISVIEKEDIEIEGFEADKPLLMEAARNHQAVHHSRIYNETYHPHYRIVEREIFETELKQMINSGSSE